MTLEINKVYNIDCIEGMKMLPDNSVDMIFTDPPYGIDYLSNRTDNHDRIRNDGLTEFKENLPLWLAEMKRVIKPNGVCCCCCCCGGKTPVNAIFTIEFIKYFNLIQTIVWDKKTIGLGWKYRPSYETVIIGSLDIENYIWNTERKDISNIVRFNNWIPQEGEHPTQKPYNLIRYFIGLHSFINEIILDPFMGGGSTAVAALKENRNFIGFEIEPKYCEIANKRIDIERNQLKIFH